MIQARNLVKRYGQRLALDRASFHVRKGEIAGFLGPNGAGKSTAMRILAGVLAPTDGGAIVAGADIARRSIEARSRIGYMPENAPLPRDLRVREYLRFRGALRGMRGRPLRQAVGRAMDRCGLQKERRRMIPALSKGYRQRLALADALLHDPPLLILDEPASGLDPNQMRELRRVLRDLGEDRTVLISTHILSEAAALCDRIIILHQGRVRADAPPGELSAAARAAGALDIEIQAPPAEAVAALEGLAGIRKVEPRSADGPWRRLRAHVASDRDVRAEVAALAAARSWPLRELHQPHAALEDIFAELTDGDSRN